MGSPSCRRGLPSGVAREADHSELIRRSPGLIAESCHRPRAEDFDLLVDAVLRIGSAVSGKVL
jgi:hypothetical protein